jgi:hypothetical protein
MERYSDLKSDIEIWTLNEPIQNEKFEYKITGSNRPLRTSAKIENAFVEIIICEDPPCHEQILIPDFTYGKELIISVEDNLGNNFSICLKILGRELMATI